MLFGAYEMGSDQLTAEMTALIDELLALTGANEVSDTI
jgi:hypothetical protein